MEATVAVVLFRLKNQNRNELEEFLSMIRYSVAYSIEVLRDLGNNHQLD